ncbi:hypothetical protein ScPMuIL_016022 [Solemya velum]
MGVLTEGQSNVADVVFVLEATASVGAYMDILKSAYILPTLEQFNRGPPDSRDYGHDYSCTLYNLVTFHAGDVIPHTTVQCSNITTSIHEFLSWMDGMEFVGGLGPYSHIAEGLSTALYVFDDIQQNRTNGCIPNQKHCILVCNSSPYQMPSQECPRYAGYTSEQLAVMMAKRGINLSIISPRKIAGLQKLYEESSNSETGSQVKDFTVDPRHHVLLHGYQLEERSCSPIPEEDKQTDFKTSFNPNSPAIPTQRVHSPASAAGAGDGQGQFKIPSTAPSSINLTQQPSPGSAQLSPLNVQTPPQQQQQQLRSGQQQINQQQMNQQINQQQQQLGQQQMAQQIGQQQQMNQQINQQQQQINQQQQQINQQQMVQQQPIGQQQIGQQQQQIGQQQPQMGQQQQQMGQQQQQIGQQQQQMGQQQQQMGQQQQQMGQQQQQMGQQQQQLNQQQLQQQQRQLQQQQQQQQQQLQQMQQIQQQQIRLPQPVQPSSIDSIDVMQPRLQAPNVALPNRPQQNVGQQQMQTSTQQMPDNNMSIGANTVQTNYAVPSQTGLPVAQQMSDLAGQQQQPRLPAQLQRDRKVIWQGQLKWHEKVKTGVEPSKVSRTLTCCLSIGSAEPDINASNWPKVMEMQLIPQALLSTNQLQPLFKNSRQVVFQFANSNVEALRNLYKIMLSGFAGCAHFPGSNGSHLEVRVLLVLFSNKRRAFVGLIPNDQAAFVVAIRTVIHQQKIKQQQHAKLIQQQGQFGQQPMIVPQGMPSLTQMQQTPGAMPTTAMATQSNIGMMTQSQVQPTSAMTMTVQGIPMDQDNMQKLQTVKLQQEQAKKARQQQQQQLLAQQRQQQLQQQQQQRLALQQQQQLQQLLMNQQQQQSQQLQQQQQQLMMQQQGPRGAVPQQQQGVMGGAQQGLQPSLQQLPQSGQSFLDDFSLHDIV